MDILCGWLHDSYTDENGKEIPFTERVCGVLKKDVFHCVSIPEFMTYEMSKEEFFRKVTNIKGGAEIWN